MMWQEIQFLLKRCVVSLRSMCPVPVTGRNPLGIGCRELRQLEALLETLGNRFPCRQPSN
jgi:hypothetical protein